MNAVPRTYYWANVNNKNVYLLTWLFALVTTVSNSSSDSDDDESVTSDWGRDRLPYFLEPTTNLGETSRSEYSSGLSISSLIMRDLSAKVVKKSN